MSVIPTRQPTAPIPGYEREGRLEWGLKNFTLLMAAFLLYLLWSAVVEWHLIGSGGDPNRTLATYLADAYGAFLLYGTMLIPGTAIYLVAVSWLPLAWPYLQRRLASLVLCPLVGIWIFPAFLSDCGLVCQGTIFYGIAPPILFGFLVRLPKLMQESRSARRAARA